MACNSRSSRGSNRLSFNIRGKSLKIVKDFKYLGSILTSHSCNSADIERATASFNKSFGMLLRKFNTVPTNVFLYPHFTELNYG